MPIKFTPLPTDTAEPSRKESKFKPLEGEFPFTVLESAEVQSKSAKNPGKWMFKLKLNVHGPQGDLWVYDYFADWFSEYKMKHFCEATGIEDQYQNGELDGQQNAWSGLQGTVLLEIEDGKTGPKSVVKDYIEEESSAPESKFVPPPPRRGENPNTKPAEDGNDIPF